MTHKLLHLLASICVVAVIASSSALAVDKPGPVSFVQTTNWSVSCAVTERLDASNSPTAFGAVGLPPGVVLNRSTGQLSGKPTRAGAYHIKFVAGNAAGWGPAQFTDLEVEALPEKAIGVFVGLVDRYQVLTNDLGGRFGISIASTGAFTGAMYVGATYYPFTGRLDACPGVPPRALFSLRRSGGLAPISVDIVINPFTGELDGRLESTQDGQIVGATFSGYRGAYSSSRKVPATLAGTYDATLTPPAGNLGNPDLPQWTSPGTITVNNTGAYRWVGKLPDGTAISGGSLLSDSNKFPVHWLLYGGKGSAQGWIQLAEGSPKATLSGDVSWIKHPMLPFTSRGGNFQAGFDLMTLIAAGTKR